MGRNVWHLEKITDSHTKYLWEIEHLAKRDRKHTAWVKKEKEGKAREESVDVQLSRNKDKHDKVRQRKLKEEFSKSYKSKDTKKKVENWFGPEESFFWLSNFHRSAGSPWCSVFIGYALGKAKRILNDRNWPHRRKLPGQSQGGADRNKYEVLCITS